MLCPKIVPSRDLEEFANRVNKGFFGQRAKKVHFSNVPLSWRGMPLCNPLMSQ